MVTSISIAIALLASSHIVSGFSTPKSLQRTYGKVLPGHRVVTRQPVVHVSFDHSLQFRKIDEVETSSSIRAIGRNIGSDIDNTIDVVKDEVPVGTLGLFGSGLILFTFTVQKLQEYLNTACLNGYPGTESFVCTEKSYIFAKFFNEHTSLGFFLMLTHAIPFLLLPWVAKQASEQGPKIKADFENFSPFLIQLSMACIGFGLALEFGWHVSDSWYYDNNFHVLNYGFYFFLISGFALWADAFGSVVIMDVLFGLILLAATFLYQYGNAITVGEVNQVPEFIRGFLENAGPNLTKVPLYIGMSATFATITVRGKEIFGNSMLWVAFFSIGINLAFIFLLQDFAKYDGSGVYEQLTVYNYILHICHDLLGTEMGVLVFGFLLKNYTPLAERVEE